MGYCKSGTVSVADALLKFMKDSIETYGLQTFYFVALSGYTDQCSFSESKKKYNTSAITDYVF